MTIACYTAVTAAYDDLRPHPDIRGVDFIAFTDDPDSAARAGWYPMPLPSPVGALSPRMRAKEPKLLPHKVLPDYDVTVWIDASHTIKHHGAIGEMVEAMGDGSFALHKHPWRDCIYDEAEASLELWKYASQPVDEQADCYRELGHPEHWGLWACGSMVRANGITINAAMERWWQECLDWTYQDQISLPHVLRQTGLTPVEFPHHQVHSNPWLTIWPHPRDTE